jgi:hypothetical protein
MPVVSTGFWYRRPHRRALKIHRHQSLAALIQRALSRKTRHAKESRASSFRASGFSARYAENDTKGGIRESHRQELRIRVVSVSRRSASSGDRLPRSFSAFRRTASARSSASKYCSIASDMMRENPFSFLRAANSTSLARCSSAISTVVLITLQYRRHACACEEA